MQKPSAATLVALAALSSLAFASPQPASGQPKGSASFFQPSGVADVCGDDCCNPNARPKETCSNCPLDCGECPPVPPPTVTVINMIPLAQSGEIEQDSEPSLAVNPANPALMAASAFTPTPPDRPANFAPIYVSVNGGSTWTLNNIVSTNGRLTSDITLRYGDTGSYLYLAWLKPPLEIDSFPELNITRLPTAEVTNPNSLLLFGRERRNQVDQPFIEARSVGGVDHVYVGENDFLAPDSGKTATVDRWLEASLPNPTAPNFTHLRIESRNVCTQDAPSIRTAIHPNGTVYAAFFRLRGPSCASPFTADLVVVRDDHG